jgi:hypothetical protein
MSLFLQHNHATLFKHSFVAGVIGVLLFFTPLTVLPEKNVAHNTPSTQTQSVEIVDEHSSFIFVPAAAFAQSTEAAPPIEKKGIENYMQCKLTSFSGLTGCVAGMTYIIYSLSSFLVGVVGNFFDIMLLFSISPSLIDQDFVKTVWTNVRNLANMAFIFILLWVAIATILRVEKSGAKALLGKVILFALLINFSLFFTRVIVDAGNMFSMFFYDGFEVRNTENAEQIVDGNSIIAGSFIKDWIGAREVKNVSGAFLEYMDANKLLSVQKDLVEAKPGWNIAGINIAGGETPPIAQHINIAMYLILTSGIFFFLSWVLFTTSFLFLTRTAILWLLMAASPLAFAGMILPQSASYVKKHFWNELISKSFCITVFLFLLWFTLQFVAGTSTWRLWDAGTNNLLAIFVIVLLKFTILMAILGYAKNITKNMCDSIGGVSLDIGKKLAGVAGAAIGIGATVATGGAAALGRSVLGGAAMQNLNRVGSDGMTQRQRLASGGRLDRLRLRAMEGLESSSFDARKTKLGGMAMGKTGSLAGNIGLGEITKGVGTWGTKRGEGGFAGAVGRKAKKQDELRGKMGDLNDKDETKAEAARKAHARYEERLMKESGVEKQMENIQKSSPYYQTLRKIASGKEVRDHEGNVIKMSQEEAAEAMGNIYSKEVRESAMRDVATGNVTGFAGAEKIVQAQTAQKVGKDLKKSDDIKEKRALVEAEKARDKDKLKEMKGKHGTPEQARASAEHLNSTLDRIATLMKLEEKRENKLSQQIATLSAAPNRSSAQNQELQRLEKDYKQSLSHFETLSERSAQQGKRMRELKEYTKLAEKQSKQANDLLSSTAKEKSSEK